jgi:hypothetical protein
MRRFPHNFEGNTKIGKRIPVPESTRSQIKPGSLGKCAAQILVCGAHSKAPMSNQDALDLEAEVS